MSWWQDKDIPPGCEEALRNARAKVNAGERLGFSIEPTIAAAQQRKSEAQQAARYPRMPRRTAEIAPCGSAPVIDGNLSERLWQGISPLEPFVLLGKPDVAAKSQTTARATYDGKAIYIALRCEEPTQPNSEKLAPNDTAIFKGDVTEVFINVPRSDSMFFQFAINSSGSFWAAHHLKDKPEPLTQPWEHAARVEQDGWTAELAIPWSILGISGPPAQVANTSAANMYTPRPPPPFRVNLARERPEANEYSSWAPVAKSFLETGNFGTWKFK